MRAVARATGGGRMPETGATLPGGTAVRLLILTDNHPLLVFGLSFFFQAEDGIRDTSVTGVQTCALPISKHLRVLLPQHRARDLSERVRRGLRRAVRRENREADKRGHRIEVGDGAAAILRDRKSVV